MPVDISRVSFVPRKNYSSPIEQQGRVALDADGTEAWAIQDRHWRSETYDLANRVHVPVGVPDSFLIDVVAGNLVIHPGRLYVDGLQAENHGDAPFAFDPLLAETRGTTPVRFDQQPYRPGFVPGPPIPGRHIIYLDVWQRTVTPLQDPSLIEPAIGVDTTGRVQTVWQVRDLANADGANCSTPDNALPGWTALTSPSAGRLSSRAHIGPPQTDPCLLPPGSGYTGLENRTYRVEIHDEQPAGTFRFKWAMHNATVASAILSLPAANTLVVSRVARDDVLRFNPGDWVEVLDDRFELEGQSGIIRQIQAVDDAAETVTLAAALPAGTLVLNGGGPDLDQQFHPRIRKWDQAGVVRDSAGTILIDLNAVGSSGLIPVPAPGTWVQLNDGVEVSFDIVPAGGRFRPGDYWVFTARTVGRQVEALVQAPPLGIHHHYCRLAVVDAGAGGWIAPIVEDCRPGTVDSAGCCTIIVRPGESIQAAIDALPAVGGCVCLKSGIHSIEAPILVQRDNVSLHGESQGAIVAGTRIVLLIIGGKGVTGIRVDSIQFQQTGGNQPIIVTQSVEDIVVSDCDLSSNASGGGATGVLALNTGGLTIEDCRFNGMSVGVWFSERCFTGRVARCGFVLGKATESQPATVAILVADTLGAITAEENQIRNAVNGVVIDDNPDTNPGSFATGSRVLNNDISLVLARAGATGHGIDVAAAECVIANNRVEHAGGAVVGIRICGNSGHVDGNTIVSNADPTGVGGAGNQPAAIVAGFDQNNQFLPLTRINIRGNIVTGPQSGIGVLGATRLEISGNILGGDTTSFGAGIALASAHDCLVTGNSILGATTAIFLSGGGRNRLADNEIDRGLFGILLLNEQGPIIAGNRISGTARNPLAIVNSTERCDVTGNRLVRCGAGMTEAVGVGAAGVFGELHIEGNEVMDTGLSPDAGGAAALVARGISCDLILEARVQSNLVTYSDAASRAPALEDRALRMRGLLETVTNLASVQIRFGFGVQIADNKFVGSGATALVELLQQQISDSILVRFERVQFSGNYCSHNSTAFNQAVQAATVSLVGHRCTVSGNQVKAGTPAFRSWHFHGMQGPFIGNISHAGSWGRIVSQEFPAPESAFNMLA